MPPSAPNLLIAAPQPPPPNGIRHFWGYNTVVWAIISLFAFLFALRLMRPETAAILAVGRFAFGLLLSYSLLLLYQAVRWRQWNPRLLALGVMLPCLLLGTCDIFLQSWIIQHLINEPLDFRPQSFMMQLSIILRCVVYYGWSMLYFGVVYRSETVEARLRASHDEAALRTAELGLLQDQVNPHFLFNALNSILAEKENPTTVEKITQTLAEYLHFALRTQGKLHPFGEEMDMLACYLSVEKFRFEDRFHYEIIADDTIRREQVPAAIIQPLVINACKYGRRTSPSTLRIRISALYVADTVRVTVANTGHWVEFDSARSTGIGLANLNRRLELLTRSRASLAHTEASGWVHVELSFPRGAFVKPQGETP